MVVDDDGATAVERRIEDALRKLTDGGPFDPLSSSASVPSFRQHCRTADALDRQREKVEHERRLRAMADAEVAADIRKKLNDRPDKVSFYPLV